MKLSKLIADLQLLYANEKDFEIKYITTTSPERAYSTEYRDVFYSDGKIVISTERLIKEDSKALPPDTTTEGA